MSHTHVADLCEFTFVVTRRNDSRAAAFAKEAALTKERNL